MLGLNRKTDYALVALATLADEQADAEHPVSARRIGERHKLPVNLLMQLLKDLSQAGLVDSVRGPGGGYYLATPPERITVLRVVQVIGGDVRLAACCGEDEPRDQKQPCVACALTRHCPITTGIRRLNKRITGFLAQVTIHDLLTSEVEVTLPLTRPDPARAVAEALSPRR